MEQAVLGDIKRSACENALRLGKPPCLQPAEQTDIASASAPPFGSDPSSGQNDTSACWTDWSVIARR